MKQVSVRCTKDGKATKRKSIMTKLGNYTLMYAKRACNVGHASTSPTLQPANEKIDTPTGFIISNAARDKKGTLYARYVHDGHGGPIPYAGNPWMRRGLRSAMKLLGVRNVSTDEN